MFASTYFASRALMVDDFRSQPMESAEGRGLARKAWDGYVRTIDTAVQPFAAAYAKKASIDLLGFYVAWHLYGGFEGLHETLGMHPSTIWRKVAKFRKTFGEHPDEVIFKGLSIDTASFWRAALIDDARTRATGQS